ncbi:axo [Cordylochernes scorpioides]|uniref:Axo n=1 Tax=Cordylochernes scorpioides TaxID=51811 RepID=A0ABY6LQJ3_9ARAC|nr:axo [Cordylochernes scorpioides]
MVQGWTMPPYLLAVLAALMAPASAHVIFSNQVFTFTPSSFLRLNLTWPTNRPWIISFSFRTLDPQGVLLYLGAPNDELYVMLENGQVLITQPFSHMDQPLYIGKGLTDDKWHDVKLQIDAPVKSLSITLDGEQKSMELHILQLTSSVLYLGGLDLDDPTWSQQFNYIPFTGCLGSLNVQHGPRPLAILQVVTTAADGCMDLCNNPDGPPPCHNGGRCINYYSHFACDCFGSTFQGPHCDQRVIVAVYACGVDVEKGPIRQQLWKAPPCDNVESCFGAQSRMIPAKWSFEDIATYTFYGHSYLSYRMYDWSDKSHRHQNRFSITFKTATDSSLLLHSYSESQQLTLALVSGTLQLEVDFGDRPLLASLGESLHDNK